MDVFLEIAKWVGLVFIGAVIAGFGKLLAEWMVKNRRKVVGAVKAKGDGAVPPPVSPARPVAPEPAPVPDPAPGDKAAKEEAKARKKADKEAWKREKKARKAEGD